MDSKKYIFHIIITKLYKLTVKQYTNYIQDNILDTSWFKEGCKNKQIKIKYFTKNIDSNLKNNSYSILKNKNIYFANKLLVIFFSYQHLPNNKHIKLLNINIKNRTIFNLLNVLLKYQNKFLDTFHLLDLIFVSRKEIIKLYKNNYDLYISDSILSVLLNNINIILNNKKEKLTILNPTQYYLYSLIINNIINQDPTNTTDTKIVQIIQNKYNINLNRRQICNIRKSYLIPSISKRNGNYYINNQKLFSSKYILKKESLDIFTHIIHGIYELCVNYIIHYPLTKNRTVYIGSSKNIKSRLTSYINGYGHTLKIRLFLKSNIVYFRYIKIVNYKKLEKDILEAFRNHFGEYPLLNTNRVL